MWTNQLFGKSLFGTIKHPEPDYATLKPLSEVKPRSNTCESASEFDPSLLRQFNELPRRSAFGPHAE